MDGLSAAASIVAVLQLTGAVIGYLNDVKNAPKECQQCTIETSNVQNLLINLRYALEQEQDGGPWFTAVRALNNENGPIAQYKQALEQLLSKVESQDGVQKAKMRLLWKFKKEEVASILSRMERLKSLVNIALEIDHVKLSLAIKKDTLFVRDTMQILQTNVTTQQYQTMMQWLSPTDFPAQQHDIISRRQEGTGQWLLDSPKFEGWLQGAHQTLFCPGIPGAGKTMMSAIAIDYLSRKSQIDDGLAYLFCNYGSQADQSLSGLLSALLKQLVQNRTDIAVPITRLYDYHSKQKSRPLLDEIFLALLTVCSDYARVYIIVDALDECTDQDGIRSRLIEKLCGLQAKTNTKLLFTSRFIPDITAKFPSCVLEVRASKEDVKRFVAGQIPRLPKCIRRDDELIRAVQSKISEAIDGMFLLARLHVDSLLDKRTKQKVLSTLERLSKGSAALDEAYNDAIKRINGQLAEDRSLARRAISWVSYAQRPLTTQELCHALAIEPGDRVLSEDSVYDVEDIISVCAGLLTIDEESNVIRLVHYTTQEYFERIRLDWNPSVREEIASTCLTYLTFDTFRSGSCGSDEDLHERIRKNAFLDYTAKHWMEHVRPVEVAVSELAFAFLQDDALVSCTTQIISVGDYKYRGYSQKFSQATTGIHLSARFGLVSLLRMLSTGHEKVSIDIDSKDTYGQTPLSWAARGGHEAVVKILIEETSKVDVDSKDMYGQTPLFWAARGGYKAVVRMLVETDKVDVNSKDSKNGQTPLSHAARRGREAVVKILIEETSKVDIDSKDIYEQTPLSWAARGGYEAIVRMLVETGKVDVNSKDSKNGQTPILHAVKGGYEAVVRMLVETGKADVDSKDMYGQTPLSWAARKGREAIVRMLMETGKVDVNSKDDKNGQTPLSWAARRGREAVVKMLIETDKVEIDSKDSVNDRTPLSWAAGAGHEAVVKILVETSKIDVNSKSKIGLTPLSWAAWGGHEVVVKALVKMGKVDIDSKSKNGQTPLSWAARGGRETVVKVLVATGKVDVNSKSKDGRTPLAWAAKGGYEAIVEALRREI